MIGKISITKHPQPNSVSICFSKDARKLIGDRISIVVEEFMGYLRVREATIMDNKTYTLNHSGGITFSSAYALSYLGKWGFEKDGDYLYLIKKNNG